MESSHRVLVIGGGIAGLSAAWELAEHDWKVTVLEARDRLGGRILSRQSNGMDVELGAEFIHGKNPALWTLLEEAELRTREVPDKHWIPQAPGQLELRDVWSEIESVLGKISTDDSDRTFAEYIMRQRLDEALRRRTIDFVEGFNAADQHKIGIHGLAEAESHSEQIEGDRVFRVLGGYGLLVRFLHEALRRRKVRLMFNAVVKTISWRLHQVRAEVMMNGRAQVFTGDAAVIGVPIGVLKSEKIRIEPSLPEKAETIEAMEFGDVTKVVMKFRERFWPEERFGFVHSDEGWFPTWWSNDDTRTITGWAGGPKGERLARQSEFFVQE